jgi:hypothetical protein
LRLKNSACMKRAEDTPMIAAHGPTMIAIRAAPVACAVVPPGAGALNIMITKENAEKMLKSGTVLDVSVVFSLRAAVYQKGATAAYMTAQVCGLKYPSGICMSKISCIYRSR